MLQDKSKIDEKSKAKKKKNESVRAGGSLTEVG